MSLRDAIIEYGQYRDVWYISEDSEVIRCLVIPAEIIEPLIEEEVTK